MKQKIKIILLTLVFTLITSYIVDFYVDERMFLSCVLFALFVYFANKYFVAEKYTTVIVVATFVVFFVSLIVITIVMGKSFNYFAMIRATFMIIAMGLGHVLYKKPKTPIIIATVVFFVCTCFLSGYVDAFSTQKINYQTLDGKANYTPKPSDLDIIDGRTLRPVNLANLKEKTIVIDFWNNYCSICFEKFPKMQALRNRYKDRPDIGFYALNAYEKEEEIKEGQRIYDSLQHNFPTYFQNRDKTEALQVQAFPTVLVLKNNKVVFRGTVEVLDALDFMYLD